MMGGADKEFSINALLEVNKMQKINLFCFGSIKISFYDRMLKI